MDHSSEQCQKSAANLINMLDNMAEMSPSLTDTIKGANNILFIAGKDVPLCFIEEIVLLAKNKKYKIIRPHYMEEPEKPDFFGVTKGKVPILMDKSFLAHDAVICINIVKYNGISGFTGCKELIFPNIAAEKSKIALNKQALSQENFYKSVFCKPGEIQNNPVQADVTDALMIMRQNTVYFGINLIPDGNGGIADAACGDIFLSDIKGSEKLSNRYPLNKGKDLRGAKLTLKGGSLQNNIPLIEEAACCLIGGGRLLIDGKALDSFGSRAFREAFNKPRREEIFNEIWDDFSLDKCDAMILKYICSNYHLAIISDINEGDIRQAGLNPIKEIDAADFLKNCSEIGDLYDAGGFAAAR